MHGDGAARQERRTGRSTNEGCPSQRPNIDRVEPCSALKHEDFKMLKQFVKPVIGVVAMLAFSFGMRAQTAPPQQPEAAKARKAASAPRRDLSGIWEVVDRMEGISPTGVQTHAPFTALGAT